MNDPIQMFHPSFANSTTWVEREAYRQVWFWEGWRSNDDPLVDGTSVMPGSELDFSQLTADVGAVNSASNLGEFTTAARVAVPLLGQPIILRAWFGMASVTSASVFTVGFCTVAAVGGLSIGIKGAKHLGSVPINGTAGYGIPVLIMYRIPPNTPATDWTVCGLRDSGTGTGQMKASVFTEGGVQVLAA